MPEIDVLRAIASGDGSYSLSQLVRVVEAASKQRTSMAISGSLTGWLRESHPIYEGRMPTESNQFRGYLLFSLGQMVPNADLYKYVRSELLFGGHAFNVAAAASTARSFPEMVDDLIPLFEPYLRSSYQDEWVDITTPQLNYPPNHPTRARSEMIATLVAFGPRAYRSVSLLDEIAGCANCGTYGADPALRLKAQTAADYLRRVVAAAGREESSAARSPVKRVLPLMDEARRPPLSTSQVRLVDQEGRALTFRDFIGAPFVLTFFYTQCPNSLKCVSTVHRLGELEADLARKQLANRVQILGMTYDPYFETPAILKKYGTLYGVSFSDNVKFLKAVGGSDVLIREQLQLRVAYGAGSVSQHGVQLFVFDKRGRLAAISDNEMWSVGEVEECLLALVNE